MEMLNKFTSMILAIMNQTPKLISIICKSIKDDYDYIRKI